MVDYVIIQFRMEIEKKHPKDFQSLKNQKWIHHINKCQMPTSL